MASQVAAATASAWVFRLAYLALQRATLLRRHGMDSPAFLSRYVSCLHAGALVALGFLWEAGIAAPDWWTPLARAIPIGYLVHDAHLICTEPTLWEPSAMTHHVIFALLVYAAAGAYPDHTARAFLAELSVCPLNLGWAMIKTGAESRWPQVFIVNSAALLLTFLRFRVYTFTLFAFEAVAQKVWPLLPMLAGLAGLNWYWFGLLCRKAYAVAQRTA